MKESNLSYRYFQNGCIELFSMDDIEDETYKMSAILEMSDNTNYRINANSFFDVDDEDCVNNNLKLIEEYKKTTEFEAIENKIVNDTKLYLEMYKTLLDLYPFIQDMCPLQFNRVHVVQRYIVKESVYQAIYVINNKSLHNESIFNSVKSKFFKIASATQEYLKTKSKFENEVKDLIKENEK